MISDVSDFWNQVKSHPLLGRHVVHLYTKVHPSLETLRMAPKEDVPEQETDSLTQFPAM